MGIQINGNTDTISAIDGGLTVSGADIGSASASSLNISGIATASGFSGNVTGNINSSGISTFSGGAVVAAGSTSAPSISPTGDSNTGIFFPSPDTIAFAEGGVEAARIDSNANLGIGTTGTGDKLTVLGRVQIQQDSGSNNRLILRGQPGSTYRWNIDNNGSSNDFRIFREDDVTTAGGLVYASLSSSGNLTLNNGNLVIGTAGKGIDFSATANSSGTMSSELLSDYEEGTFTPTITGGTTNPTITYGSELQGRYVKVGNLVTCWITISTTARTGGSGTLQFPLPFTSTSGTNLYMAGSIGTTFNLAHSGTFAQFGARIGPSSTVGTIFEFGTQGGTTTDALVPVTAIPAASSFFMTVSYSYYTA